MDITTQNCKDLGSRIVKDLLLLTQSIVVGLFVLFIAIMVQEALIPNFDEIEPRFVYILLMTAWFFIPMIMLYDDVDKIIYLPITLSLGLITQDNEIWMNILSFIESVLPSINETHILILILVLIDVVIIHTTKTVYSKYKERQ